IHKNHLPRPQIRRSCTKRSISLSVQADGVLAPISERSQFVFRRLTNRETQAGTLTAVSRPIRAIPVISWIGASTWFRGEEPCLCCFFSPMFEKVTLRLVFASVRILMSQGFLLPWARAACLRASWPPTKAFLKPVLGKRSRRQAKQALSIYAIRSWCMQLKRIRAPARGFLPSRHFSRPSRFFSIIQMGRTLPSSRPSESRLILLEFGLT